MDNADLEKLKVSPGKLLPKFKASVTDYSVTVASSVAEIKLSPLTSDSGASYVIKGVEGGSKLVKLTEGKTQEILIIVSAEDGKTTKTYTIAMRRLSADDATLSQLDLSAGVLKPSFSPLVNNYECYLPCSIDSVSIRAKSEDAAMKLSMRDGSPVGTVQLSPGCTLANLDVQSASGKSTTTYSISFLKCRLPVALQLKSKDVSFECAVCCGVVHQPCTIKDGPYVYCQSCLEELTRTSKIDPFTGMKLEEEGWMVKDYECDAKLAKVDGTCPLPSGELEAPMQQIGAKLMAERIKLTQTEEPTEGCADCGKKVPKVDMTLHKELLCTAKNPSTLKKQEVKLKPWEKSLVDESIGNDAKALVKKAEEWERHYLKSLPTPGKTVHYAPDKSPLDHLQKAARCYASAIKSSPKDFQAHLGLGFVIEEFFYLEDLYGLQRELYESDKEGEAEVSSKEEEFLAICKLHGVAASAPIAIQLKAVEAEYHSLKDAGQTHKADHVQGLHAWKSKKVLEASQGSYSVDTESPLYRAKLKYQDAVKLNPDDATACYHLGRLSLLLGEKDTAKEYLLAALSIKPTLSPARLCLGLVLPTSSNSHVKNLLSHGLTEYLRQQQELHETQAEPQNAPVKELHSKNLYRSTNTLIVDAFLHLSTLGGHTHLKTNHCLMCVTACVSQAHLHHRASTYERLLWASLKARSSLLDLLHKQKDSSVLRHCKQLSALISNSGLSSTPQLREMQMEVFQLGVVLQPSSSEALCHLGNGQLMQYDAANDKHWLTDAELSFRASIDMEGKAIVPTLIPDKLKEEEWWKKKKQQAAQKNTTTASVDAKKPAQNKPAGTAASRQPAQARGKPAGPTSRAQPPSKTTPTAAASSRTTARGGAAATRKPGAVGNKQPVKSGPTAGRATGGPAPRQGIGATGGKGVATLGELKSNSATKKPANGTTASKAPASDNAEKENKSIAPKPSECKPPGGKAEINKHTYHPHLGLARTLAKNTDAKKREEAHSLYRKVMSMAPEVHDAYIELGEMLAKTDPEGAVDVYARFPFSNPPTFDDAFLHGEIVRLIMNGEKYDNPRLCTSMIAMGKALGIGVLEKQVSILENKFQSALLKKIYSGIHGKPIDDPELQAFFKFKCWL